MAMAILAELANVAWLWASGPSVALGQKDPSTKSPCALVFNSRKFAENVLIL
jgi:hypothetical protein